MDALLNALTVGLAMTYITLFIQALPWPAAWASRKPLSCPVCLIGWQGIIAGVYFWPAKVALLTFLAAAGSAVLFHAVVRKLQGPQELPLDWRPPET